MLKNYKVVAVAVGVIIIIGAAYGMSVWREKNQAARINDFESCSKAGYAIMETFPEQCRTADGRSFTRKLTDEEKNKIQPPEPDAGLANPASTNCLKLGGRLDMRSDDNGGQTGYCILPNGQECEEWALFRNECGLSPSSQMGVLKGKVTVGPICPVERVGQPCPVPPEAYTSRQVIIYKTDGVTEVAMQNFSADGSYEFALPPGTYIVKTASQGVGGSKDLPQTVIIKSGETVSLNFGIDTGIR